MRYFKTLIGFACAAALLGCNKEDLAQMQADGKATGAACRHAGRAIEDCFTLNSSALRSAMFDGWKEMNDYMRENNIATVVPKEQPEKSEADPEADADAHAQPEHAEVPDQAADVAAADQAEPAAEPEQGQEQQSDEHAGAPEAGKPAVQAEH